MDHRIQFDQRAVTRLRVLQAPLPEGPLRDLLGALSASPQDFPRKNAVLAEFRKTLKACKSFPQADKEALVTQLEAVLDILRIESSDGLLNEWLLGVSL